MRNKSSFPTTLAIHFLFLCSAISLSAQLSKARPSGPGSVIVTPKFGGTILGFDVDQNGTEGLLSESSTSGCGYATETFDQKTGAIIKILSKGSSCADDEVTRGIVGSSVGLVEHDHSLKLDYFKATYELVNPVSANQFNGSWTPPGNQRTEIWATSHNQGTPINAFQFLDLNNLFEYGGASFVAENQFGPVLNVAYTPFIIGFDTKTDQAVLPNASQPFGPTTLTLLNVKNGTQTSFVGVGSGIDMGVAVDSDDDIAVTATFGDFSVEFYDLKTGSVIDYEPLPFCTTPACTAYDVEYDPIHKLFFVAQAISSESGPSTIYVYDTQGNLQESLNGFNFTTARFDVIPVHIALHPSDRSGFVDVTNNLGVGAIQSFTY
jgi:hypothetical protein